MTKETTSGKLPAKCMALKADILNDGGFLDKGTAAGYITNYLNGIKAPSGAGHNFGYLFGLANINTFMLKISAYNTGLPADKQIAGVRIYLGRSQPAIGSVAMEDVLDCPFLMPVMADGTDLYKMPPLTDPDLILGDPRPCPNECLMLSFV